MTPKNISDIENGFELDANAHSKGRCSFNVIALCSAEEQRVKRFLRISLTKALESQKREIIERVERMKESYSGGLERFEEKNKIDMKKLVYAYNQALDDVLSLLKDSEK